MQSLSLPKQKVPPPQIRKRMPNFIIRLQKCCLLYLILKFLMNKLKTHFYRQFY